MPYVKEQHLDIAVLVQVQTSPKSSEQLPFLMTTALTTKPKKGHGVPSELSGLQCFLLVLLGRRLLRLPRV